MGPLFRFLNTPLITITLDDVQATSRRRRVLYPVQSDGPGRRQ